jgi:MerR family regulatory protein
MPETRLRIGELSERSGVSPELLRRWERRYGLLEPVRSSGGLPLYSRCVLASTGDPVSEAERITSGWADG